MSFSADWLALRAEADRRARNSDLAGDLAVALFETDPVRVLDLGSGTGANLGALSPLLGARQHWVLTDNDSALLDAVTAPPGIAIERRIVDLSGDLAPLFDPAPDLVTASAFFDLCGEGIIDRLVGLIASSGAAFHTVLTYDGRQEWAPPHPSDADVLAAFDRDQQTDKGLGQALGPRAAAYLAEALAKAGYAVQTGPSDWSLSGSEDGALIEALTDGTADAVASALGPDATADWRAQRAGSDTVMIGHQDILALPPTGDP